MSYSLKDKGGKLRLCHHFTPFFLPGFKFSMLGDLEERDDDLPDLDDGAEMLEDWNEVMEASRRSEAQLRMPRTRCPSLFWCLRLHSMASGCSGAPEMT